MTRPYLLLVRSSSSSIGGLVMPSGAGATPDTGGRAPSSFAAVRGPAREGPAARSLGGAAVPGRSGRRRSQQSYQLVRGTADVVVDDHDVELPRGVQLRLRQGQPPLLHRPRLRAAAGQPVDQRGPGRWGEEDQLRLVVPGADLARPLQLDLEEGRSPGREP